MCIRDRVVIDPRDSKVVYVAAEGPLWGAGGDRGLYKTTDGGKNWKAVLTISENTGVVDVAMDPSNPDIVYAAAYQRRRHEMCIRDRFDRHLFGEGDDVVELVNLTHGVVEDAGYDAAVAVAGRSGVALAQAEAADEDLAGFVEDEFEAHAAGIVLAADEAVIFLQFEVAGFVAVGLGWHGDDFKG